MKALRSRLEALEARAGRMSGKKMMQLVLRAAAGDLGARAQLQQRIATGGCPGRLVEVGAVLQAAHDFNQSQESACVS